MKRLCIYHGGCTDGVAAAWAVWKRYPDATFYPGVYQQEPPWDLIDGAEVIIVDFSYKRLIMEKICNHAVSTTVLDHHKTAEADLSPLFESGHINKGHFDMDRCGAMLAWDFFHNRNTRPRLLQIIDAQDRWLDGRDAKTIMALRSYPHRPKDDTQEAFTSLMRQWSWLMTEEGLAELKKDGDEQETLKLFEGLKQEIESLRRDKYHLEAACNAEKDRGDEWKRRESWTSVQEKLPEKGEYVLLITDRYWNTHDGVPDMHVASVGYLDDYGAGNFWSIFGERGMEIDSFAYWMKIPDYPVEEE